MKNVLEVTNLSKTFRNDKLQKHVLKDVHLHVQEGEFVALLGPSGSGKSTLLHLIGGLERVDDGSISINGQHVNGQTGHISFMPQQASLLPWLSVSANIELALTIAGVARAQAKRLTSEWLERIGLLSEAKAYPHTLSGGMQQRVSFLRALLAPQALICLDEPFGALDALTRLQMQRWLLSLWEQHRRSVLMVTHSIDEALLLADRIIVLSPSPATVVEEIVVPFSRPRAEHLWNDPEFHRLKQYIYERLQ